MSKEQIDSILLVNSYLTKCNCESKCLKKTELTRRYLSRKISIALENKKRIGLFKSLFSFINF